MKSDLTSERFASGGGWRLVPRTAQEPAGETALRAPIAPFVTLHTIRYSMFI